jgi:hypothetical protein
MRPFFKILFISFGFNLTPPFLEQETWDGKILRLFPFLNMSAPRIVMGKTLKWEWNPHSNFPSK